jgi:hypothetical protein
VKIVQRHALCMWSVEAGPAAEVPGLFLHPLSGQCPVDFLGKK